MTSTAGLNKEQWTTTELAEAAGVSSAYLRRIMLEGRLQAVKVDRQWFIGNQAAQDFLNRKEKKCERWTTSRLAKAAGVSTAYLRRIASEGRLKASKPGYQWIIDEEAAQCFIDSRNK